LWSPPFRPPNQNVVCTPHLPHARHMPRLSQPPCFDHPNNTGRRVQTMQLLIMQFTPTSCHLIPLRSKYYPNNTEINPPPPLSWALGSESVKSLRYSAPILPYSHDDTGPRSAVHTSRKQAETSVSLPRQRQQLSMEMST
jgi:hypothetical protein